MYIAASRLTIFAVTLLLSQTVVAENFPDRFRNFILGEQAEASARITISSLDPVSQQCMDCHNGNKGQNIHLRSSGAPPEVSGFRTLNHPVGMRYEDASRRDRFGYRARTQLDPKILLVNGQMGCASCHELKPGRLHTSKPGNVAMVKQFSCMSSKKLVTGSRPDELCMTCHTK